MIWHVHSCLTRWCVIFVCIHSVLCLHVKGSGTFDCDRISSIHVQLFLSQSGFCLQSWALTVMQCRNTEGCILGSYVTWASPWWTRFYYTGPVSQTVSQFQGKRLGETHWAKEPHWTSERQVFPPVNHNPQLKWCRISQEDCRVELGEGGPNVTLATQRSVPVN